jgi:hypothetical protein
MVLRALEHKIEALFEGIFGRAFRTNVQPVELARKLAKEMDDHRTVSVSRVYVPNEYSIYLSPADREQFTSYEENLKGELQEYLAQHARREDYALLTSPQVLFETDADLDLGEFAIATRMAQPEGGRPEGEQLEEVAPGSTMIYKSSSPVPTRAVSAEVSASSPRRLRSRSTAAAMRSSTSARCSAGRGIATSSCLTRTSRGGTQSSGRRERNTGSSTSARRTGSR